MPSSSPTPRSVLRKIPWLRWVAYVFVMVAFFAYMRRVPVHVIPVTIETKDYDNDCMVCHPPSKCPFGHTDLVSPPVVYGNVYTDEEWKEVQRKVANLEVWHGGAGCVYMSETVFVCKTCRFVFGEMGAPVWEKRIGHRESSKDPFARLPEIIVHAPLPEQKERLDGVIFRQKISYDNLIEESCSYWVTGISARVIARFQEYFKSHNIEPVIQRSSNVGRDYYYAYAPYGLRYLRLEIIQEESMQTLVSFKLIPAVKARADRPMKTALNL